MKDRREGNNRLVSVEPSHPLYAPMSEIVAAAYGPVPVLRELVAEATAVEEAFIYGSLAARRQGQPGWFPRDVDVMVVGELELEDLMAIQARAKQRLGMEVNIHRTTALDWRRRTDNPFLAEVASRQIVELRGRAGGDKQGAQ